MNATTTFPFEEMSVSIEETADALTYTFAPQSPVTRPGGPLLPVFLFTGFPLALLGLVVSALVRTDADRPGWELALTGVCVAQLTGWFLLGLGYALRMLRVRAAGGTVLAFTAAGVRHGGQRVCALADLTGLRIFIYPAREEHAGRTDACLSLVVGEEAGTHGLFGSFEAQPLRAFAAELQRRIEAFRANQGLLFPLAPLSVVETTEPEAERLMHTRPPGGSVGAFVAAGVSLLLVNRWAGSVWCVAVIAGLYGSARVILGAGFPVAVLLGHGFVGLVHFLLLMFHLSGQGRPPQEPVPK